MNQHGVDVLVEAALRVVRQIQGHHSDGVGPTSTSGFGFCVKHPDAVAIFISEFDHAGKYQALRTKEGL